MLILLWSGTVFAAVEVTFQTAPEGPVAHDARLSVVMYVRSETPVESVTTSIGEWEFPLNRQSALTNSGWYGSTWAQSFNLPELPDGPTNLAITVKAIGETYVTNRVVIIHSPPTLTVYEPFDGIVLEPGERLHVKATASDEDLGEVWINVGAEYVTQRPNVFDERLNLSRSGVVLIQAFGNHGEMASRQFTYLIQTNAKLRTVAKVPGIILNVDSTRILYRRRDQQFVSIKTIGEQSDGAPIYQSTNNWIVDSGLLTADGAIVVERDQNVQGVGSFRAFEVGPSNEVTAFGPVSRSGVQVQGNYVAWVDVATGKLFQRDLRTRTNLEITNTVNFGWASHPFSLAENGNISFCAGNPTQLYFYRSGAIDLIPNTADASSNWTDGTNVVFYHGRDFDLPLPLVLYTPGGSLVLSTTRPVPPLMNNGWVAFYRAGNYTFSPTGSIQMRSPGTVLALNADGDIMTHYNDHVCLQSADGATVDYGLTTAQPIMRNGQWEFIYYSALLRPIESFDKQMVIAENESRLNVRFIGEPGKTYQIETTPSLQPPVTWTPHRAAARVDANNSMGFVEPAPSTNRFYRAVEVQQ